MSSWRRELTVLRDDGLTGGHCQQADALPSSWDREQSIVVRGVELTGHGPGCVAQSRSPEALACRRDRLDEPVVPKGAADETFMSSVAEGYVFPPDPPRFESVEDLPQRPASRPQAAEKECPSDHVEGSKISSLGSHLFQRLMEVLPLRSTFTGGGKTDIFPLPTSIDFFKGLWNTVDEECVSWVACVCVSLNALWGGSFETAQETNQRQRECLEIVRREVDRFCHMDLVASGIDWQEFFRVRSIDYKGDEVRVARWIKWENIEPALPPEIGLVPLEEVCSLGCREYVMTFDSHIKSRDS